MHSKNHIVWVVLTGFLLLSVTWASATVITNHNTRNFDEISYETSSLFSSSFASIRQPAEFEPMQGVLIRYPFGISYNVIKEMAEDVNVVTIVASVSEKNTVLSSYQSQGVDTSHCSFLIAPTDTYWTRDYGPWFIVNEDDQQGVVDFTYNRPRPNDDQIPTVYANNQSIPVYDMPLVATGGNYMTDGQGISVSTTLIWEENTGYTHEQIDQMLAGLAHAW